MLTKFRYVAIGFSQAQCQVAVLGSVSASRDSSRPPLSACIPFGTVTETSIRAGSAG